MKGYVETDLLHVLYQLAIKWHLEKHVFPLCNGRSILHLLLCGGLLSMFTRNLRAAFSGKQPAVAVIRWQAEEQRSLAQYGVIYEGKKKKVSSTDYISKNAKFVLCISIPWGTSDLLGNQPPRSNPEDCVRQAGRQWVWPGHGLNLLVSGSQGGLSTTGPRSTPSQAQWCLMSSEDSRWVLTGVGEAVGWLEAGNPRENRLKDFWDRHWVRVRLTRG